MPGAAGRTAAVLLPESGLIADTADRLDHGCQAADPCAGTSNAMVGRALAGWEPAALDRCLGRHHGFSPNSNSRCQRL